MEHITLESDTIHELAEAVRDGCLQTVQTRNNVPQMVIENICIKL